MAWGCGGLLRPWDLQTGKLKSSEFVKGLHWAGFSRDGKTVRVGGNDGELVVWDTVSQEQKSYRFSELRMALISCQLLTEGHPRLESE